MPTRDAPDSVAKGSGPAAKRQKVEQEESTSSPFNTPDSLFSPDHVRSIHSAFTGTSTYSLPTGKVGQSPFPSLQLFDVFKPELVQAARRQLTQDVTFSPKANDLYSYKGSGDLSDPEICEPDSPLAQLRDALYSDEFTRFISQVTGVRLFTGNARPDLSSHQYWDGDHLLAHDDDVQGEMEGMENEGRRIAFILYLVDEKWQKEDGGSLDLFECNKLGHPTEVTQSLVPAFNSIALFEVTPTSYHTVAEVTLSPASTSTYSPPYRLSISGWFHGPLSSRLALPLSNSIFQSHAFSPAKELVNPTYLDGTTQATIQESLIKDSSIELREFLLPHIWDKLVKELAASQYDLSSKTLVGPAHLRHFYRVEGSPVLSRVMAFFKSSAWLALLTDFTSLEFSPKETKGRVQGRLFKRGCYTLLHDQGHDPDGVDIVLGLGVKQLGASSASAAGQSAKTNGKGKSAGKKGKGKAADGSDALTAEEQEELDETGWLSSRWGGQICYCPNRPSISEDDEEEDDSSKKSPKKDARDGEDDEEEDGESDGTLTISPRPNTLSIVVRSVASMKFVKYVTASARHPETGADLARLDIEGVFEVDLGGEDDEVEGELVEEDSEEENGDEEEEWTGIAEGAGAGQAEDDGSDELDDD